MEEDLKILEEFLSLKTIDNKIIFTEKFLEAFKEPIRNLIARNKELEQKCKIRKEIYNRDIKAVDDKWKSKVKEKIEELKKEMLNEKESLKLFYQKKYCYEILQELLED